MIELLGSMIRGLALHLGWRVGLLTLIPVSMLTRLDLSVFTGDFNRRFAQMDLEPVLQFVINRLMRGESLDLSILQSLLSIMSGVSSIDNDAISDDQLRAYATGREMIRESFNSTVLSITRPAEGDPGQKAKEAPVDKTKSIKKSLPRLINALRDAHLAMPIWIALAQTRQGAVDTMAGTPIKAMSSMQDNVSFHFSRRFQT